MIIESTKGKWLVGSEVATFTGTMSTYNQEGIKYVYKCTGWGRMVSFMAKLIYFKFKTEEELIGILSYPSDFLFLLWFFPWKKCHFI